MPTAETIVVRSSYVANNDSVLQLAPAMSISQRLAVAVLTLFLGRSATALASRASVKLP